MKAAVVRSFTEDLSLDDLDVPTPGPGQALVRVEYTGVCHTDLHAARGDWDVKATLPFVPGHEGAGTVVAVGEGVTRLAVGDRVGNAWLWSACGECEFCETGWETLCPQQQNAGFSVDGSFGQYMLVDARFAARIPDGVDLAAVAPVLCAGVTVYKGLKRTDTQPGQWVLVQGVGGLGHMAVQYAVATGRRVVAVDVDDAKLELARQHGAELTVNAATTPDVAAAVQAATGGGVHGAVVTATAGSAFPQAVAALRRGGTVVLIAVPPEDLALDIFSTVLLGITVRGSIVGNRKDMAEALDFFARGKVAPTVTVRPLSEINEIFADMERGAIDGRVVMDMTA